jgi:hypothetical protein
MQLYERIHAELFSITAHHCFLNELDFLKIAISDNELWFLKIYSISFFLL